MRAMRGRGRAAGTALVVGVGRKQRLALWGDGQLRVGGAGTIQRRGGARGVQAVMAHHRPSRQRCVLQVAAEERLDGQSQGARGMARLDMRAVTKADLLCADLKLGVAHRPAAHVAGEIAHHPLAVGITAAQMHVPFLAPQAVA